MVRGVLGVLLLTVTAWCAACARCPQDTVARDGQCLPACNSPAQCSGREVCDDGACVALPDGTPSSSSAQGTSSASSGTSLATSAASTSASSTSSIPSMGTSSSEPPSSSTSLFPSSTSLLLSSSSVSVASSAEGSSSGTAGPLTEMEPNNTPATANPLPLGVEMHASIATPAGAGPDLDCFSVDVTQPGTMLRATMLDPMGTCPDGVDTYLTLYGPDGTVLTFNDDHAFTLCSALEPSEDPLLRDLPVGRYVVEARSYLVDMGIAAYVVRVELLQPGCGNGVVEPGEQCDDGNLVPLDGCNATCALEASFTAEQEPNETLATATPLFPGTVGFSGAHSSVSDVDFVSFTLPAVSNVTVMLGSGVGSCGTNAVVEVLNAQGSLAVGGGLCGRLDPRGYFGLQLMPAGTHALRITPAGAQPSSWFARVSAAPPRCQDGMTQLPEQCDDGNAAPGDGCAPDCTLEASLPTESEPNNTAASANALGNTIRADLAGAAGPDEDWFSLTPPYPDATLHLEMGGGYPGSTCPSGAWQMELRDATGATTLATAAGGIGCLAIDGSLEPGAANLSPTAPPLVRVLGLGTNANPSPYVLQATWRPPSCGDGIVQTSETCDDANLVSGDGCSATCAPEGPFEAEPNGDADPAMARALAQPFPSGGGLQVGGNILPTLDRDWFILDLAATSSLRLETRDLAGTGCSGDTMVALYDASGATPLVEDDDNGLARCSLVDGWGATPPNPAAANLPPGRYYVEVRGFDTRTVNGYLLTVTAQ